MANAIPTHILSDLLPKLDRNRNRLLDPSEAGVSGRVGNGNGFNGFAETAEALASGRAALKDFQLAAPDADEVANRLAGGDAWVSKEDVYISDAARSRIDGFGGAADGRVSRTELSGAFQRQGFAIHRDGIFLSREVEDRFRSERPTPPPVDRPTPPPIGRPTPPAADRPTPPPVGRPTPPSADRPTPPPISLDPREVSDRYLQQRRSLSDLYNSSRGVMSYSEFQIRDRQLVRDAVADVVRGTRGASYTERRSALSAIYNGAGGNFSYSDFQIADRSLVRAAVEEVLHSRGAYVEKRSELSAIYNRAGGNFSYNDFQIADRSLVRAAVEDVLRSPGSFDARKRQLNEIYNAAGGNFSYSDFQLAERKLLDQSLGRL